MEFIGSANYGDYQDFTFVRAGGWGTVFSAQRISDGKRFAMKFFGYTSNRPNMAEIEKEIRLMVSLRGVDGVVQLEGVFSDTAMGYMPNKNRRFQDRGYPVIVMEMIDGGELLDRIMSSGKISEHYVAGMFKSAVDALRGIHSRRFVHRDLKLDNILLMSQEADSIVKLIDFGLMVSLPDASDIYSSAREHAPCGTAGYFAPETLLRKEYSFKTDIWQLGCILYSTLCGHPPYSMELRYQRQITDQSFYPMTGPEWENISEAAKDIVVKMLTKDSSSRISLEEICLHPWLSGSAPCTELGNDYARRVKSLALRGRLKRFFQYNDIENQNRNRRDQIGRHLSSENLDQLSADSDSPLAARETPGFFEEVTAPDSVLSDSLKVLKRLLVSALVSKLNPDIPSSVTDVQLLNEEIGYEMFCSIMAYCDLSLLACPAAFHIFDINHDGKIEIKEFLLGLISFGSSEDEDAASLYFNLFDVDEDGFISRYEMTAVVSCLFDDGLESTRHVDELFDAIDINPKDNRIDLEEFKLFYNTVLLPSTIGKSRTSSMKSSVASSISIMDIGPSNIDHTGIFSMNSDDI